MWFVFLAKLLYHKGMTFCFLQILFTQQPIVNIITIQYVEYMKIIKLILNLIY